MIGNGRKPLEVLFIPLELPVWARARALSYSTFVGLADGATADRARFFTLPSPWLPKAREIIGDRRFDQVWFEARHTHYDDEMLDWLAGRAPVRLALVPESLDYTEAEHALSSRLREARPVVERALTYATHALMSDEVDVAEMNGRGIPAMWLLPCVSRGVVRRPVSPPDWDEGTFVGAAYGDRLSWLRRPELRGLLRSRQTNEMRYRLHVPFNLLHHGAARWMATPLDPRPALAAYLFALRRLRRTTWHVYLGLLRRCLAVVNLPMAGKSYSSRVWEGMAVGRPVIAWKAPDRPRNLALFEDGREILLFPPDEPDVLAAHIRRLRADRGYAESLAANARRKLLRYHTTEKRVRQILDWIETGVAPAYDG